jgi:hypothetical protein
MSKVIQDLRNEGWNVTAEDLTFLSPYLTPGLKRFGEYGVDFDRDLEPLLQDILSRTSMLRSSHHRLAKEA